MSADGFTVISLSSLLSSYGDTVAQGILDTFEPYADGSASDFVRTKAIPMEKRDLSRTYLAFRDGDKALLGFVSIGMKCIRIPEENLLSRSLLRQCNIDGPSGVAQAYLLGQLVRSKDSPKGFGELLIDFTMKKVKEAKGIVGCRVLRLDCADELIGYYERHGFSLIRKNEDKDLNQMVTLI